MQSLKEWMAEHNYNCVEATQYAKLYNDVADAYDRTYSIDYMFIGLWEHAMDGLWDGGRSAVVAWVEDVREAYPEQTPNDGWPIGSIPENQGRFEYYDVARAFAHTILNSFTDERDKKRVGRDLCDRIRAQISGNPMENAA